MKNYPISIIIPTLNEEKFIGGVIESLISQSFPFEDMDIMVIDGGSKDATISIVAQYISNFDNIRLIHNPKKIQSIGFNLGVKNSKSPFIVRLDAHAIYDREYIRISHELLKNHTEYGNVGGVWNILPQSSNIQAETNAILNKVKFGIGGATFRVGAKTGPVDTVPFGAFPRKVIDEIGGMREDLARGEDNEYNSRIRKAGYLVYLDPRIKCIYYARPTLSSSCRQMYNNGKSIGQLLFIDSTSIGIRHLIPTFFTTSLLMGICLGFVNTSLFAIPIAILCLYTIASIIATISACCKYGFKYLFSLPLFFFSIHVSYGLGTLREIILRAYTNFKSLKTDNQSRSSGGG